MDVAIKGSDATRDAFRAALTATELTKFDAMRERMVGGLERVHAYERRTCKRTRDIKFIAACAMFHWAGRLKHIKNAPKGHLN
jgi:hypothetical protein